MNNDDSFYDNPATSWQLPSPTTLRITLQATFNPGTEPNSVTYPNNPATIAAIGGSPIIPAIVNFPLT